MRNMTPPSDRPTTNSVIFVSADESSNSDSTSTFPLTSPTDAIEQLDVGVRCDLCEILQYCGGHLNDDRVSGALIAVLLEKCTGLDRPDLHFVEHAILGSEHLNPGTKKTLETLMNLTCNTSEVPATKKG